MTPLTPEEDARLMAQAPEMYRAIVAKLKDCRENGECADGALREDEYCSDECAALARVIAAVEIMSDRILSREEFTSQMALRIAKNMLVALSREAIKDEMPELSEELTSVIQVVDAAIPEWIKVDALDTQEREWRISYETQIAGLGWRAMHEGAWREEEAADYALTHAATIPEGFRNGHKEWRYAAGPWNEVESAVEQVWRHVGNEPGAADKEKA